MDLSKKGTSSGIPSFGTFASTSNSWVFLDQQDPTRREERKPRVHNTTVVSVSHHEPDNDQPSFLKVGLCHKHGDFYTVHCGFALAHIRFRQRDKVKYCGDINKLLDDAHNDMSLHLYQRFLNKSVGEGALQSKYLEATDGGSKVGGT